MSARSYFHSVAHRVRALLDCGAVLLALHCPADELSHPLLQHLPDNESARFYGAGELQVLFQVERLRALRDIACQSGQARFINEQLRVADGVLARCVAIAPLLYPAGVAGYLVLADACSGAFTPGDARLLDG